MQSTATRAASTDPRATTRPGDRVEQAMATLVADIAEDATTEPARYLHETIVPEGGE